MEAAQGGETPGSLSGLLTMLGKVRVYYGGNYWQQSGCCC